MVESFNNAYVKHLFLKFLFEIFYAVVDYVKNIQYSLIAYNYYGDFAFTSCILL